MFCDRFFLIFWFLWIWVRESSARSESLFGIRRIIRPSGIKNGPRRRLRYPDLPNTERKACLSIKPGRNCSQNKSRAQGKFIDLSHMRGVGALCVVTLSSDTVWCFSVSLLIGPLQLEATWYKIQHIGEQKNMPDSKIKQNTFNYRKV